MTPRIALFPGSFDPFTIGHKDIVDRALPLFDSIVIGVGYNISKPGWIPVDERVRSIERIFASEPRVKVISYSDLTVQAAGRIGARFLLRGVRSVQDFEYERQLADVNRNISGIESVLIYASPALASVSSSMVRELARFGMDTSPWLPASGKP